MGGKPAYMRPYDPKIDGALASPMAELQAHSNQTTEGVETTGLHVKSNVNSMLVGTKKLNSVGRPPPTVSPS